MKIKLLKDLPDYKAGYVFSNPNLISHGNICIGKSSDGQFAWIEYAKYPDFFQVIDEDEDEELADKRKCMRVLHLLQKLCVTIR